MNIVMWIGNEPNQKALANKMHARFGLSGIVLESRKKKRKISVSKLSGKLMEKLFAPAPGAAWRNLQEHYRNEFPEFPKVPSAVVEQINSEITGEFSQSFSPDLILVSGTSLIRKKLLAGFSSAKILNLHTGLSPYVKGGPNCTNWCLANNQFHLIGNTIMWIDEGIDSGNILATEFTPFSGKENLNELHLKVMNHAHDLYLRAVQSIHEGRNPNLPQKEIADGKTFYSREWNWRKTLATQNNFQKHWRHQNENEIRLARNGIKVFPV